MCNAISVGSASGPDNRESVVLCARPELRAGILLHLPRWHHAALDLPLLHGHQGLCELTHHPHARPAGTPVSLCGSAQAQRFYLSLHCVLSHCVVQLRPKGSI